MKEKCIQVLWAGKVINTCGMDMGNGLQYIYLPFDKEYHYVSEDDVIVCKQECWYG